MADQNQKRQADDALSSFTDELLSGDRQTLQADTMVTDRSETDQLASTAEHLWQALGREDVPEPMAVRLQQAVKAEWEKSFRDVRKPAKKPLLGRLDPALLLQPRVTFAFAFIAVFALGIVLIAYPPDIQQIAGTATGSDSGSFVAPVLLGIGLAAAIAWLLLRNRK